VALVDLGTNGEIAIGNRYGIVCASTAAGPAFEAGSIRMGMRAATGAIAHVTLEDGQMKATVVGDVAPQGICGSGLVDAVAVGLDSGAILSSGASPMAQSCFQSQAPWFFTRRIFASCSWPKAPSHRDSNCFSSAWEPTLPPSARCIWLAPSATMCKLKALSASG